MVDADGNQLIDLGSGIAVTGVGNSAPRVVKAVQRQVAQFTHTCFTVTPYEGYIAVAEKLNELTPGDHEKRSALFNSGAEAVENAIKIARHYTKKNGVVVFDHAYHGRTNLTMGMTAKNMPYKDGFGPLQLRGIPRTHLVPLPRRALRRRRGRGSHHADREAGRRIEPRRDHHRAHPGRGRLHRSRRGLPPRAAGVGDRERRRLHPRRGADGLRPHRPDVRRRVLKFPTW